MDEPSASELLEQIGDEPILSGPSEDTDTTVEATPAQEPASTDKTDESKEAEAKPATEDTKESTPASGETKEESVDESKTEPQTADDRRREQARQGWQQRQRLKEAEQNFDSAYQPKTTDDLLNEDIDPRDARIQALELQRQFDLERSSVIQLNADMASDAIEVENDFDIFNPKSANYDADFAQEVMKDYRLDAHLEVDERGNILRADRPLYDYIQRRYDSYTRGLSKGSVIGQQTHQEMMARTENPGGSSSQSPTDMSKLSAAELLDRIGDQPLFG